jgi:hypothetical protein
MPLVRIDTRKDKDLVCGEESARVVYEGMVAIRVPANARFQVVKTRDADNFLLTRTLSIRFA